MWTRVNRVWQRSKCAGTSLTDALRGRGVSVVFGRDDDHGFLLSALCLTLNSLELLVQELQELIK